MKELRREYCCVAQPNFAGEMRALKYTLSETMGISRRSSLIVAFALYFVYIYMYSDVPCIILYVLYIFIMKIENTPLCSPMLLLLLLQLSAN